MEEIGRWDSVNVQQATRVVVLSDAHGHKGLIERALEHAGFDSARDGLVYAGDVVDGGTTPREVRECIALLQANDAQVLWGNHEVAALVGYPIAHQDPWTVAEFGEVLRKEFDRTGELSWRLALSVQGVLVSHAGISEDGVEEDLAGQYGRLPDGHSEFVRALNSEFEEAVRRQMRSNLRDRRSRVLGRHAPHRLRVFDRDVERLDLPAGVLQVAGHSAPETYADTGQLQALTEADFYIVDPCYQRRGRSRGFRYATLEGGRVRVVESA